MPRTRGPLPRRGRARRTGLEPGPDRGLAGDGLSGPPGASRGSRRTTRAARDIARACRAPGFPLVALVQLLRVYGQALAQVADAEVRLFHLYVHEPLMQDGVPAWRSPRRWRTSPASVLPLAAPIMDRLHRRLPAALRGAGRDRPHGGRPRRRARSTGPAARRDRLRRPRRLHAPDRGAGRRGGRRRAVERFVEAVERDAARDARVDQEDRRRGDGRRLGPAALPPGRSRFQAAASPRGRRRGSGCTTARCSTATATTTAARSTGRPRGARAAGGEVLVTRPSSRPRAAASSSSASARSA